MQIFNYQFKPALIPSLMTTVLLVVFIKLGLWQAGKADIKQAKMDLYEQRSHIDPIRLDSTEPDTERLIYSPVIAKGRFEPEYQILLDNQVYKGHAGYHVITPLHLSGSDIRILVDRGWIPVGENRNVIPSIVTPADEVELKGIASLPPAKYFELSKENLLVDGKLEAVVQNLDIGRYQTAVKFQVQKFLILMDPASPYGGFVREWPKPDLKIEMNRGYALQWYFMAIALMIIYLALNLKKKTKQDE